MKILENPEKSQLRKALRHKLFLRRSVFHSEADFQHELAWEIHDGVSNARIRLERPFDNGKSTDIYCKDGDMDIAIELKYSTKATRILKDKEEFILSSDGLTKAKYDFWKDVERLQKFTEVGIKGYAIFLTNNISYWKGDHSDPDFSIREGRGKVTGCLLCKRSGSHKYLDQPINLGQFEYNLGENCWRDCSLIDDDGEKVTFKYLVLEIKPLV